MNIERHQARWKLGLRLVKRLLVLAIAAFLLSMSPRPIAGTGPAAVTAAAPQYGDDRFGVTLFGDPQLLLSLGVKWFITGSTNPVAVPPGATWVQIVDFLGDRPVPSDLAQRVAQHPGSYWLMSNEPNAKGSPDEQSPAQYARVLHDAIRAIKAADSTAKLVGPNIINFDFTCVDCPGFTSGHAWTDEFLNTYKTNYGGLPPFDIWSIHTYPLEFNRFPQVNAPLMEQQLVEFRKYLDATPGLTGVPIWDSELGTHWGYDGLDWRDDGTGSVKAFPVGDYRSDMLAGYMQDFISWLKDNGPALGIERWFFYATYVAGPEAWESTYAGINLLDGSGPSAHLNQFGALYRRLAGL